MDEKRYDSVIKVFVDLYNKGLIYRGVRMVNWDPQAMTAVSDEEVNYTDEKSKLYYVSYKIVGEDDYVTVATTRPERYWVTRQFVPILLMKGTGH